MSTRNYSNPTLKILWALSGNRCAFPGCDQALVVAATPDDGAFPVGEISHIVAASDDGPRGDPSYPADQRDLPDNLILFCPTHHRVVDRQPNSYTAMDLSNWKANHQSFVQAEMEKATLSLTFPELEAVARHVAVTEMAESSPLVAPELEEKLRRNDLTASVASEITIGLLGARVASEFVDAQAILDPSFPKRLRAGFLSEYHRLRSDSLTGDALFLQLRFFAAGPYADLRLQAAALSVLVLLFQLCDLFE